MQDPTGPPRHLGNKEVIIVIQVLSGQARRPHPEAIKPDVLPLASRSL